MQRSSYTIYPGDSLQSDAIISRLRNTGTQKAFLNFRFEDIWLCNLDIRGMWARLMSVWWIATLWGPHGTIPTSAYSKNSEKACQ